MIDFHCHVDLYPAPSEIVHECNLRHMFVLSVTTTPSAWDGTAALSESASRIRTALGLHPQLAAERYGELPLFDEKLPHTQYVGEVGLDGGQEFKSIWEKQTNVFEHVLESCTKAGGKILSIHSRRATTKVLDYLERWPNCGIPVMHWFSGSVSELERAKDMGCWFSVGPAMLATKKGRELGSRLPPERVLTETDGPFAQVQNNRLKPWNVAMALSPLSKLWNLSESDVNEKLLANLRSLTKDFQAKNDDCSKLESDPS